MSLNLSTASQQVNFGPCHMAIKGMMRLVLELDGETVLNGMAHMGFTHRGLEKSLEDKNVGQVCKILENVDQNFSISYGSVYAFVLSIERALDVSPPLRGQFIRVLLAEMGRISCHLSQIAHMAQSIDFNLISSWALNLEEELGSFLSKTGGEAFISFVPGGASSDLSKSFLKSAPNFLKKLEKKSQDIRSGLLNHAIFKLRTVRVGTVSSIEAISWGLSGPALRASQVAWDLRRSQPYDVYEKLDFKIPVGKHGDSFDRTSICLEEIFQSIEIVRQCLEFLPEGDFCIKNSKISPPSKEELKSSTEALIHHYKLFSEGVRLPKDQIYNAIESARGELGIFVSSKGGCSFDRVRLRTPGFFNMQAIESLIKGHNFSDLSVILASFDIYSSEVDR
jgi:NADH-quinone oxidoreductase subunit D